MALERLQKVLARAGLAARRKAELLITAGRVRVDGALVSELGVKVDPRRQRIEVDGHRIQLEPACYGVLHKPRGMVTTVSDPEGRPTAQDILSQVGVRVVPVGRLDFNTSGALLFTNDGDFAQALAHARSSVPKVYAAKVQKYVGEEDMELFRQSIDIDGKPTRPADVRVLRREGDKTWLEITLREGKNRQVRRLGEHAGSPVVRLARLSHAGIDTVGLKPGKWRFLTATELKELKQKYGVPKKIPGGPPLPVPAKKASTKRLAGGSAGQHGSARQQNSSGQQSGARHHGSARQQSGPREHGSARQQSGPREHGSARQQSGAHQEGKGRGRQPANEARRPGRESAFGRPSKRRS